MSDRDEEFSYPLPIGIPQQSLNGIVPNDNPLLPYMYPVIDTDLGEDNVENDIPDADLEDL